MLKRLESSFLHKSRRRAAPAKTGWPALLRNTRNVGDFTRWKGHDSYGKAFGRLLRNLKAGA